MSTHDIEKLKGEFHALKHVITGLIVTHPRPRLFYEAMKLAAADREQAKTISIFSPEAMSASDEVVDYFLSIAAQSAGPGQTNA